ncbi:SSI family serine proteinase inhibitor [Streptomyces cadmiisoli]|uniref:SSI family serine proteinase inhibitor n=1 Tax=Streptomyces cadmiisoli TaxID=2184053 RepID=UPI0036498425
MSQVTPASPALHAPGTALRRLLLAAGAPLAAITVLSAGPASATPAASGTPVTPTAPAGQFPAGALGAARDGDRLTVTVRDAGGQGARTYELRCNPAGGSHPDAGGACRALDRETRWGSDAFAPVPGDSVCTMQYGGPATARVTGTWSGRPVDAAFDRSNGCEIARWDRLVPLLPATGA